MALLFTIATDRFRLTWSGIAAPPDATAPTARLHTSALALGSEVRVGPAALTEADSLLRLAEQTRYRIFARSLTGAPLTIRHPDPLATRDLVSDDDRTVLSGTVNFGGQVGQSRFVVLIGGREEAAFEVEVFPTKVSFAEAEAMRTELDEALAGLAFEYLRSTRLSTHVVGERPRRATWLTLLRRALPDLEAALGHIVARPHRDLVRTVHAARAERVRRPDASLRRALLTGLRTGAPQRLESGAVVPEYVPERRAVATLDTPEHRWLRYRLDAARSAVSVLRDEEGRLPRSARRCQVLADLADTEERLGRLGRSVPLASASVVQVAPHPTQRLLTAPGYAEAYTACRRLAFGLALADGPVPHATRDLHALYEMWTYLTVVRRVADVLGQPIAAHAFVRAEQQGLRLSLRRGRGHGVSFDHEARRVRIEYNPRFGRYGLLAQRPDILLTVEERDGGRERRRYVLDAKYRRDDSAAYVRRVGVPGPPEDALGDLHRYRDAILDGDGDRVRRSVVQAVALYPYRASDAFTTSRLWTSIEAIGIGAIPLLPGATDLLDRWLRRVLAV